MAGRGLRIAVTLLVALLLPYFAETVKYYRVAPVLAYSWIMGIYALSFALLLGQLGLLSFGHALFLGLGAYATVYATVWAGIPYLAALLISMAAGALLGLLVALVVRRAFHGIPFAFITLTIQLIVYFLYKKKELAWLSGGDQGLIAPIPGVLKSEWTSVGILVAASLVAAVALAREALERARGRSSARSLVAGAVVLGVLLYLLGEWVLSLSSARPAFRAMRNLHGVALLALAATYLFVDRLASSPIGVVWRAIRDSEVRAASLGYNVFKYKALALTISGAFAALAGGLYVPYALNINPERTLSPMVSVYALIYAIVGGIYPFIGPVLGALLVSILEILLAPYVGEYSLVVVGLIFIAVMVASPLGLAGILSGLEHKLRGSRVKTGHQGA